MLEELKRRGLLYVDDGSVQGSTAGQIAGAIGLDYSVVSVQIDAGNVAKQGWPNSRPQQSSGARRSA